jgi:hypothetical protein
VAIKRPLSWIIFSSSPGPVITRGEIVFVKKNAKIGEETSKLHMTTDHPHTHKAYHIVNKSMHVDNPRFNCLQWVFKPHTKYQV